MTRRDGGGRPGGLPVTAALPPGQERLALLCSFDKVTEVLSAALGTHVADGSSLFPARGGKRTAGEVKEPML